MINKDFNSLVIKGVITIILALYILFLYMDLYNVKGFITTDYIKYLCIILCFLLSLIFTKNSIADKDNNKDIVLLQLGMFITVFADLCLVIFNFYILGIVFFSMVQIIYAMRYSGKKSKITLINFLIIFLCILLLYIVANVFIVKINVLLPFSLFYSICLLTSVIKAIEAFKDNLYPSPIKYKVVLGMILFLLCDICVALSNIATHLPLEALDLKNLEQISRYLIWVFYLPSQLMLSLSGRTKIKVEKYNTIFFK